MAGQVLRRTLSSLRSSPLSPSLRLAPSSVLPLPRPLHLSAPLASEGRYQDELLQKQMANDNPFDTYVTKPEAGRGMFEGSPILVPSTRDSRMVGCCCEDDYQEVVWFELKKGPAQRCDCGNYFQLLGYDPLDPNIKAKFGQGFGSGMTSVYY